MHRGGGGEEGSSRSQSQYGMMPPAVAATTTPTLMGAAVVEQQHQQVEEASPISSRPPAVSLEELIRVSSSAGLIDEAADRGGGNRWPRQETLALIQIRSDMDAAFRDATLKGPLWEHVSRKLAELGYKRSAKKCKEKFENVHKYYKRTKEGRAGRQDGKSYRFFSQLEALHSTAAASSSSSSLQPNTSTLDVSPVSVGIPMPVPFPPSTSQPPPTADFTSNVLLAAPPSLGISFSSDATSSPPSSEDDEDGGEEQLSNTAAGSSRKRKRQSSGADTRQMMHFFEGLMSQVMRKQESMQQRFLEAIEKREHDRMIREEDWKRQEAARLSREHELMAEERGISASRDATIVSLLQKITGQTIHLPSLSITPPSVPPQPPPPAPPAHPPSGPQQVPHPPNVSTEQQQQSGQPAAPQHQHQQQVHFNQQQASVVSSEVVMAVLEQQIPPQVKVEFGSGGGEATSSSRWPKAEVLALIELRSGLENKYQDVGPKGPFWEEISAGMLQMGYNRSAKRCKEKWENINKYYKKVKESNKQRPEDSKTCPYYHQLDALYRKKILGGGSSSAATAAAIQSRPEVQPVTKPSQEMTATVPATSPETQQTPASHLSERKNEGSAGNATRPISLLEEGSKAATKKPEDIVKELMEQQDHVKQRLMLDDQDRYNMVEEDEYDDDEEEDDDNELQEESMAYRIEFQRQNNNKNTSVSSVGRRNGAPSFTAMVQ